MNPTEDADKQAVTARLIKAGAACVCAEFPQQVNPETLCNNRDLQHDSIISAHLAK